MPAPPELKVISSQSPVIKWPEGRQPLLITSLPQAMRLKLFFLGLAVLLQMSCSQTEVGNTTGQPQPAGESQDSGVMPLQNGLSSRPLEMQ